MSRNPALDAACLRIAERCGIIRTAGPGTTAEILDLARAVGMEDDVLTRPTEVANEITRYLDDVAKNP